MNRFFVALGLITWLGLSSGCGASVSVGGHWHDPTLKHAMRSVLVVGISERGMYRRLYEDELVARLKTRGLTAQQSYLLVPGDDLKREQLEAAIVGKGFDSVLMLHLVDIAQRREYHEGPSGGKPFISGMGYGYGAGYYGMPYYSPYYGGMGAYYSVSYSYTHSEGYYDTTKTYNLESVVYALGAEGAEAGSEKMVWALMTEAVDPNEIMELIGRIADLTLESLKDDGLLAK